MFSRFRRRQDRTSGDIHDYIRRVTERGDHGRNRVLLCNANTLNHALEMHFQGVVDTLKPEFEKLGQEPAPETRRGEREKVTVHNYLGNVSFQCYVSTPKSLLEIVDLFMQARQAKLKIRAVGAFHSWSPLCETDGFLVQTTGLTGTSPTDASLLKDPSTASIYYDVLSGTTLKDTALELEKHGRALINMGGYSALHIVGICSTGAHGSGITIPPLAGMIRSITLVSGNFAGPNGLPTIYRIEPTNGITDPGKHRTPSVTLVQDDATFDAMVVGLGAFGVVYSVTIETVRFYWIKETRESTDWPAARRRLARGPTGDILRFHNAEVWLNPYTSRALVSKREAVVDEPPDDQVTTNRSTNALVTFINSVPALERIWREISKPGALLDDDAYRELGKTLAVLLKTFPLLVPTAVNIALDTQFHREPVIAKYYDLYDIGFANRFGVICCEVTYPMNTYIAGVDAALSSIQKDREREFRKALVGFLSVRFTSSTPATLSMGYSVDTSPATGGRCYLEIFGLADFYDTLQTYDDIVKPIQEKSIGAFLARHHWGQYLTPGFKSEAYKARDPQFAANIAAARKIADKYDPEHIMTNTFLDKVVFTVT